MSASAEAPPLRSSTSSLATAPWIVPNTSASRSTAWAKSPARRSGISRRIVSTSSACRAARSRGICSAAAGPSRSLRSFSARSRSSGSSSRPTPVEGSAIAATMSAISGGASLTIQDTGSSPTSGSGVRSISLKSHSLASCSGLSCDRAIWPAFEPSTQAQGNRTGRRDSCRSERARSPRGRIVGGSASRLDR